MLIILPNLICMPKTAVLAAMR